MSTPTKITVTGAAGQIGYALLFRIDEADKASVRGAA